jgi:hypothetical protein
LFSSQALLDVDVNGVMTRLSGWHKKLMTRPRLSNDGGTSMVASQPADAVKSECKYSHGAQCTNVVQDETIFESLLQTSATPQHHTVDGVQEPKHAQHKISAETTTSFQFGATLPTFGTTASPSNGTSGMFHFGTSSADHTNANNCSP